MNNTNEKATWETPELEVFGTVAELTLVSSPVKSKKLGAKDDFGVVGISNP